MLKDKRIILGVTGGIAAYKSATLVRLLVKAGAEVQVIMTEQAHNFITPLTLATLSRRPVLTDFAKDKTGEWNNHVDLGLWADLLLIAPATANTLAKMANGHCDSLLLATYLSARCPVAVAPAMDLDMYKHPAVVRNLELLKSFGHHVMDAASGELASGLVGQGRMPEPEQIMDSIKPILLRDDRLAGKNILITAGPTQEALDPVRYITNHSSGKMGYAIANLLAVSGAQVTMLSGVVNQKAHPNVQVIRTVSASDMYENALKHYDHADIVILSAAVADYRPSTMADKKIKKSGNTLVLELVKTFDIAAELGKIKSKSKFHVGFALETNDEAENAKKKLNSKKFDMIVLNSLQDVGAGFGHDTNKITILDSLGTTPYALKSKNAVAQDIVEAMLQRMSRR
ncbi:MAG: bifunctional phosphopantothenoylcysteine decarboxylase/phosphopantothenate--cysteine ligase CoaBC [Cytophagales bacterium]|nr:MAG: bifunctional phosphopantothenoylcysteine decarboxylase/phosphopantothenate--cysteine ligase CoaBC [Cytophagales bacterium]TAF61620.1 MAG: bifunctional phosphopantothenoylcysteine decarboxylase/phosphopantothenate--cysteine ligase CoaBC [Cytophagales bacterium]